MMINSIFMLYNILYDGLIDYYYGIKYDRYFTLSDRIISKLIFGSFF